MIRYQHQNYQMQTAIKQSNSQFLTTTATYKEGIILPRLKPTYPVGEIIVVYVPEQKSQPRTNKKYSIEKMKKEDEQIWQKIEPKYRKIRAKLSKQKFPSLYA